MQKDRACFLSPPGWEQHVPWLPVPCVLKLFALISISPVSCLHFCVRQPDSESVAAAVYGNTHDTSLWESHPGWTPGTPWCCLPSTLNRYGQEQSMCVEPGKPAPAVPPCPIQSGRVWPPLATVGTQDTLPFRHQVFLNLNFK